MNWKLDDERDYFSLLPEPIVLDFATTAGDQRRKIRRVACDRVPHDLPEAESWAFRILVEWSATAAKFPDLDNPAKPILDAFSMKMIVQDGDSYRHLGLYEDDDLRQLSMVQIAGMVGSRDRTVIEIFGRRSVED